MTKQETHVERQDSIRQEVDFGYTSVRDITSFLKSNQNKKIDWKLYDTSKPKDPDTGKHPLLAEGSTDETTKTEQNTNISENDSTGIKAKGSTTSSFREDDKKESEKQKEETTVPKQIGNVVWALVVLVALVVVGWLVYKKSKS